MTVMHSCDVRLCIEPTHLSVGTQKKNIADMIQKGRGLVGEKNGHAKLTKDDVVEIRRIYSAGEAFQYQIAAKYGVTQSVISEVVRGVAWGTAGGSLTASQGVGGRRLRHRLRGR